MDTRQHESSAAKSPATNAFSPARPVTEGSRLAIVAPSGPFVRESFDAGVTWLRERYEVTFDDSIYSREGYFAGNDDRRREELLTAIRDPKVDAILCARGGYGATRLLPDLDPQEVREANKLIVGFSDITALHALWTRAGVRSIHAPMAAALGKSSDRVRAEWIRALEGNDPPESWALNRIDRSEIESVSGRLFGGNQAVIASLLGTPFLPDSENVILFLEDVGERPYRIDRVLTSLLHSGWLGNLAGIVLGAFTEGDPGPDGVAVEQVIAERLGDLGIPVLTGFSAGHIDENEPLVFGTEAKIKGTRLTLTA